MTSFMWGYGFPVLFKHENLHDVTHRRTGDLFGGSGLHYYRHVLKMVQANNTAVKYDPQDARYRSLPDNYLQHAREIRTPLLLVAGQENARMVGLAGRARHMRVTGESRPLFPDHAMPARRLGISQFIMQRLDQRLVVQCLPVAMSAKDAGQ